MTTTKRRNITQPAEWWAAFEEQAKRNGETLSGFAGDSMLANLDKDLRKGLSDRPAAHRPKKEKK